MLQDCACWMREDPDSASFHIAANYAEEWRQISLIGVEENREMSPANMVRQPQLGPAPFAWTAPCVGRGTTLCDDPPPQHWMTTYLTPHHRQALAVADPWRPPCLTFSPDRARSREGNGTQALVLMSALHIAVTDPSCASLGPTGVHTAVYFLCSFSVVSEVGK